MPYVPVPKDLSKVKTKIAFNLTKRQLVCFSIAGAIGLPVYFFTRGTLGNSASVLLMMGLMLPFFFLAMFEKNEQTAEKIIRNYIRARWFLPARRVYNTENIYNYLESEGNAIAHEAETASTAGKRLPDSIRLAKDNKAEARAAPGNERGYFNREAARVAGQLTYCNSHPLFRAGEPSADRAADDSLQADVP